MSPYLWWKGTYLIHSKFTVLRLIQFWPSCRLGPYRLIYDWKWVGNWKETKEVIMILLNKINQWTRDKTTNIYGKLTQRQLFDSCYWLIIESPKYNPSKAEICLYRNQWRKYFQTITSEMLPILPRSPFICSIT